MPKFSANGGGECLVCFQMVGRSAREHGVDARGSEAMADPTSSFIGRLHPEQYALRAQRAFLPPPCDDTLMPGAGAGCGLLASSARDELEGSLGNGVIRLERLCRQQFFFSAVKIACLAVDDAELSMEIGDFRTIATGSNRFLKLPDCLGPVMSLFGLNTVVRQRARAVEDTPLFLDGEVARHELIRFNAIG